MADAPHLTLIDPIGYLDFVALEMHARAVVTDSGGVQEETTYLHVPCFTLRDTTERPITVTHGTNRLLGLEVERVEEVPGLLGTASVTVSHPDGWDGSASERAVNILVSALGGGSRLKSQLGTRTIAPVEIAATDDGLD